MSYGFASAHTNQAISHSERFELQEGLQHGHEFDPVSNWVRLSWCVPNGSSWPRKVPWGKHPVPIRTEVLSWHHLLAAFGDHRALDVTLSKLVPNYDWPSLVRDTGKFSVNCLERRELRGHIPTSPQLRSSLYDGPFYTVLFDYVWPIRPTSRSGCFRLALKAVCAFSGGGWATPTPDSTSEAAARPLVERVPCDLAGFLVFLRHDGAAALLTDVIRDVRKAFNMGAPVGTSWRRSRRCVSRRSIVGPR